MPLFRKRSKQTAPDKAPSLPQIEPTDPFLFAGHRGRYRSLDGRWNAYDDGDDLGDGFRAVSVRDPASEAGHGEPTSELARVGSPIGHAIPYHRPWTRNSPSDRPSTSPLVDKPFANGDHGAFASIRVSPTPSRRDRISANPPSSYHPMPDGAQRPSHPFAVSNSPFLHTSPSRPISSVSTHSAGRARNVTRKSRIAPSLNIIVAGGKGLGKTSWVRTFLSTIQPAPGISTEAHNTLQTFGLRPHTAVDVSGDPSASLGLRRTKTVSYLPPTEVCDTDGKRVQLSIIDTPGLDFSLGDGIEIQRSVRQLEGEVEMRYLATLEEENKLTRMPTSAADPHIHVLLYFIDPLSILQRSSARPDHQARGRRQSQLLRRSQSMGRLSYGALSPDIVQLGERGKRLSSNVRGSKEEGELSKGASSLFATPSDLKEEISSDEEEDATTSPPLSIHPSDLRVLVRLSELTNVIPIVAKSDLLTVHQLEDVKQAVKEGLQSQGLGLGVFSLREEEDADADIEGRRRRRKARGDVASPERERAGTRNLRIQDPARDAVEGEDPAPEEEEGVKIIKVRPRRSFSDIRRPRTPSSAEGPAVPLPHSVTFPQTLSPTTSDEGFLSDDKAGLEMMTRAAGNDSLRALTSSFSSQSRTESSRHEALLPFVTASSLSPAALAELFPFALIAPEPEPMRKPAPRPSPRRLADAPPVPALPEELALQNERVREKRGMSVSSEKPDVPEADLQVVEATPEEGLVQEPAESVRADSPTLMSPSGTSKELHDGPHASPSEAGAHPIAEVDKQETKHDLAAKEPGKSPDLRKFERRYRWGNINVLDPGHCDFTALRNALLRSHLQTLKESTKAHYERYRTKKLHARRATKEITQEQAQKLLQDLALI